MVTYLCCFSRIRKQEGIIASYHSGGDQSSTCRLRADRVLSEGKFSHVLMTTRKPSVTVVPAKLQAAFLIPLLSGALTLACGLSLARA